MTIRSFGFGDELGAEFDDSVAHFRDVVVAMYAVRLSDKAPATIIFKLMYVSAHVLRPARDVYPVGRGEWVQSVAVPSLSTMATWGLEDHSGTVTSVPL